MRAKTVQLGIGELMGSLGVINWGGIMACGVVVTVPVILLFAFVQKYLSEGLTAGADVISAVTPFYYKFSSDEIVGYYSEIADKTNMPAIIYNFPMLTGYAITQESIVELEKNHKLKAADNPI